MANTRIELCNVAGRARLLVDGRVVSDRAW
jgi:hypothetical protein